MHLLHIYLFSIKTLHFVTTLKLWGSNEVFLFYTEQTSTKTQNVLLLLPFTAPSAESMILKGVSWPVCYHATFCVQVDAVV